MAQFDSAIEKGIEKFNESSGFGNVFFQPSIINAWIETYRTIRKTKFFVIHAKSENNEALIPLALWQRNWKNGFMKSIIPIGYSDYDYHNPLFNKTPNEIEKGSFWNELIDFLKDNVKYDNIIIDGITDSMIDRERNWHRDEICPYLELSNINNESDLMSFFKTSLRGDIRRQIRRLKEIGELEFKEYSSWEEIPPTTFNEFMAQHSRRWPKAYKAPHFHENLLKYGLKSGIVHFSTLSVGGKEIAWHLGFSYRKRYYYYMPAGNQEYFKYSPTKIHLFYLVRRAVEQGYEIYDHLRGEENYKSGWSNGSQYVNSLIVNNSKFSTKIKTGLLKLKSIISNPKIG